MITTTAPDSDVSTATAIPAVTRSRHSTADVVLGSHSMSAVADPMLATSTVAWIALVVAAAVPLAVAPKPRATITQKT
ncbi:hypothetical protein QN239_29680 [Mycolicibacterium sp. Y3]